MWIPIKAVTQNIVLSNSISRNVLSNMATPFKMYRCVCPNKVWYYPSCVKREDSIQMFCLNDDPSLKVTHCSSDLRMHQSVLDGSMALMKVLVYKWTALYINDSFWKSASVVKQSLMVFVANTSWIPYHTYLTFLWNIIRMHIANQWVRYTFCLKVSLKILHDTKVKA